MFARQENANVLQDLQGIAVKKMGASDTWIKFVKYATSTKILIILGPFFIIENSVSISANA